MTISNTTTKKVYSGNGIATVFAYDFIIQSASDVQVFLDILGVLTLQAITTNYTVSGVGNPAGGNITFVVAPETGVSNILIRRATPLTQEVDYIEGDEFPAETHESALDKLTKIVQEQQEELDRAVKVQANDSTDPDVLVEALFAAEINADLDAAAAAASAAAALDSQNAAASSASSASTSATAASNSASAASTSETNAANSATAASNSASAASTSETNAANSAAGAAASEANVISLYDSFDDRYLGPKATAPTLDNDGNALITGALYWNTVTEAMYTWSGTAWVVAYNSTGLAAPLPEAQGGTGTTVGVSGFKNKIIGGDFTTNPWQRGTSFAALATGVYSADRFRVDHVTSAVVSVLKTADAPTASQAGLFTQHCLHIDVTTADATIAASDIFVIRQYVEGLNAAYFGFGQAGSRSVTLSFWVKAAKTGIHCVSFTNSVPDRNYISEYTINAADTWEYKTITIPVDTSGTWLYDSGIGLRINFALAMGTNFQGAANTWQSGNFFATSNQVNELDSTANNFKIALVQLEAGSTATAFETRSYGTELDLCQRYYEKSESNEVLYSGNVTSGSVYYCNTGFKVEKRANPTLVKVNSFATSFPATVGTATIGLGGFRTERTADATGSGAFIETWTASSEL
jgi:hypothetical protein